MEVNEAWLVTGLQTQDETAFEQVFKTYYKNLHTYAFTMLRDEMLAEEMVQTVFCKLWERAAQLNISGPLSAYLYRAVNNESLNHLKHVRVRTQHQMFVAHRREENTEQASKKIYLRELEENLRKAMNDLPEQCRTIFQMSRFQELRYREIADRLEISVKTVENQMGKALKILRNRLADFLVLILFFINCKP